jgi:GDP-L-fucose synthase
MSKILITGGCGFLGRHFTKTLLDQGHFVFVVDDLSNGIRPTAWPKFLRPDRKAKLEFIHIDTRYFFEVEMQNKRKENFDLVIHLAATVGGRSVIEGSPIDNARTIAIDAEFFRWLVFEQPKHTIYMSSPAIYPVGFQDGEFDWKLSEVDLDLSDPVKPLGIPDMVYGWSKLTAEYLALIAAKKHGLNIFCPRPFSGYGEDQSLAYPMPSICKRAVDKEDPLIIWGSGKQTRDWIHVDDIIECVLKTYPMYSGYNTLNIGTGIGTDFFQLAKLAAEIVGYSPEIEAKTDAPEGVMKRVADIWKLTESYKPVVPRWDKVSLKEGMTKVIEYLKDNDKYTNHLSK